MGLIPNFYEMKESVEESIDLLRRAIAALEKLAAEQERANDLYAEVNQLSLAEARNVTDYSHQQAQVGRGEVWCRATNHESAALRQRRPYPVRCPAACTQSPRGVILSSAEDDGRVDFGPRRRT